MPRLPLKQHPILHYKNKYYHHKAKRTHCPDSQVVANIGSIKFPCDLSLGKMAKSMYCGGFDFEIKRLIKKFLKPGDTLIDVGANMGYFTAIGLSKVGKTGQVHSFEPMKKFVAYLKQLKGLNPDYKMIINNCALGEEKGTAKIFENKKNIGGHSLIKDFVGTELLEREHEIQVNRLDDYILENSLENISVIKIDTEGYEFPVILGMKRFLEKTNKKPIIIAELSPKSFEILNQKLSDFEDFITSFSYSTYAICGCHKIDIKTIKQQTNVVLLPS